MNFFGLANMCKRLRIGIRGNIYESGGIFSRANLYSLRALTIVRTRWSDQFRLEENSTINKNHPAISVYSWIVYTAVMGFGKNFEKRLIFHFETDQTSRPVPTTGKRSKYIYRFCFAVVVLELCLDKATCMSLWGEKEMVQRESFDDEGRGKEKSSLWRAVNGFPSGCKRHHVNLLNPGSELSQAQSLQVSEYFINVYNIYSVCIKCHTSRPLISLLNGMCCWFFNQCLPLFCLLLSFLLFLERCHYCMYYYFFLDLLVGLDLWVI